MDFYKMKRQAQNDVQQVTDRNEKTDFFVLLWKINNKYGLGEKFLKDYLKIVSQAGFVRYEEEEGIIFNDRLIKKNEDLKIELGDKDGISRQGTNDKDKGN